MEDTHNKIYLEVKIIWKIQCTIYSVKKEKKNLEIGDMGSKVGREKERRKFKKRDRVYSWVLCLIQKEKMKI